MHVLLVNINIMQGANLCLAFATSSGGRFGITICVDA